ncbi:helix-turn-helix transcriptional regulator [Paenibacillus sp. strain BS8-2]
MLIQDVPLLVGTHESNENEESPSTEMKEITLQLMAYIRENCCESLHMTALARRFHISKSYMFKIFKHFTGYTPHQYVMQERINRAMLMLNRAHESVTQVAARTGFNDSSHFIRAFKGATGMTPGEFKELASAQCN